MSTTFFRRKSPILYSLQVWLASVLVGPILVRWYLNYSKEGFFSGSFATIYGVLLVIALVASLPSFALLIWGVSTVKRRTCKVLIKKAIIALFALLLAALAVLLFLWWIGIPLGDFPFEVYLPYALPLFAAVFFFRFPKCESTNRPEDI